MGNKNTAASVILSLSPSYDQGGFSLAACINRKAGVEHLLAKLGLLFSAISLSLLIIYFKGIKDASQEIELKPPKRVPMFCLPIDNSVLKS